MQEEEKLSSRFVPFPLLAILAVLTALLVAVAVYYLIKRWL
jgi:phage gp36-like protein